MTVDRLSALALMRIDYGHNIDYIKAVEMFLNLRPRKNTSLNLTWCSDTEIDTRRWDNL